MNLHTKSEVYKNSKSKLYTDGSKNTTVCRSAVFKDSFDVSVEALERQDEKWKLAGEHSQNIIDYLNAKQIEYDEYVERRNQYRREHKNPLRDHSCDEVRSDSVKRAKDGIFDLVLNNDFEYFFTGTINPEELDSKDPRELLKPLQKWLKNMVIRYDMQYIMIAERHKKGGIHFHGLFKADKALRLEDSGTKLYKGYKKPMSDSTAFERGLYPCDGRIVYNLKSWSFGFSTCIQLQGDRLNTAFYVTKYITKDCKKIFGRFYWHSRNLKKPEIVVEDMDFDSLDVIERNGFKYVFTRGEDLPVGVHESDTTRKI